MNGRMTEGKSRFGCTYKLTLDADRLPVPDHDMTQPEANELKDLETAFIEEAKRLGVHVTIALKFPRTKKEAA